MHMGSDGYLASCLEIVTATKEIVRAIREDFADELYVLGDPLVSVVAFGSKTEGKEGGVGIYEVGDMMDKKGWHRAYYSSLSLTSILLASFIFQSSIHPLSLFHQTQNLIWL